MRTQTNRILPLGLVTAVAAYFAAGVSVAQVPTLSTKDKVAARVGVFQGGSTITADGGGRTGQTGDLAADFGMGTGPVFVEDATFLNALAATDEMTFAFWAKKNDIADGSAFWAYSPASSGSQRGLQAHLPWSNDDIFFDTAGCCDPPQRINGSITTFAPYMEVGDDTWWNAWHFYVFTKKGVMKEIWIDGQWFLDQPTAQPGVDAAPLPTDFTKLFIGSDGTGVAGLFHGLVDDFAIFGTALSEATIGQLYGGALPTTLPASDKLTAYWDFNDIPAEGVFLSVTPTADSVDAAPNLIQVVHTDGSVPWTQANVTLKVDGTVVTPTFVKAGTQATLTYVPSPLFTGQTSHKVSLSYPMAGGAVATLDLDFIVGPYTEDVLKSYVGTFMDGSIYTANAGGRTSTAGDWAADFGGGTGPVHVHDASFLNALSVNDQMCFAFWMKKPGIEAGSAFWADSPTSNNGQRGFQAHCPWSDSNIYFDTAGCCEADLRRINASITTFAYYTDATWWNGWHHFVFQKNLTTKEIWIDGQFFLTGENTSPLPTDFTDMFIGATSSGVNLMSGQIDDFAVFGAPLGTDSITALFNGTLPTALPAADKLAAYWNFNDFPATGLIVTIVPEPGETNARPDLISVVHRDGTLVWEQGNVSLKVDDVAVTPTVVKSGTDTSVNYIVNPRFEAESTHKATLTFPGEGGTTQTLEWEFTVGTFPTISEDVWTALGTGDATKPGMKARVWQVDQPGGNNLGNRTHRAEQELAGIIGPNVADLTLATDGVFALDLVNWNQAWDTGEVGNFTTASTPSMPDVAIPGIPGFGSKTDDSIAAEIITYIEFPTAGFYSMGVYSDDGFKVTVADTPPANNLALVVTGAASAAGTYHALSGPAGTTKPFTTGVSGKLVYMDPPDGCTAVNNPEALRGNIVLIDRGTCEYSAKIKAAKDAGAIAVVIANNRDINNADGIYPIEMGVGAAGYQDIPAVMISMPDGDTIKTGFPAELTVSLTPDSTPALGEQDGGALGANSVFGFLVPTAGVYPFRCVWYEGGGGAHVEWFSVTQTGAKVLINDRTNASTLKGFRARTVTPQPKPTISIAAQGGDVVVTFTGTLEAADTVTGQFMPVNTTSPYTAPLGGTQKFFRSTR